MRVYGGGLLLLLLIGVALWVMLESKSAVDTLEKSKPAVDMAHQMAGQGPTGVRAKDSVKLEAILQDGKMRSLLVSDVTPDGPMASYYGLQRNDSIVQAGSFDFRDDDPAMCKDMVLDAFTKMLPLQVIRDGRKITLPLPRPAAGGSPAGTQPPDNRTPLQRQLDAIGAH